MADPVIVYDPKELRQFAKVIREMGEIAQKETAKRVGAIAERTLKEIRNVAASRGKAADRVAQGGKVSKTSVLGEIKFGFASQKFSGGATTQFNTRNEAPGQELESVQPMSLDQRLIRNFQDGQVQRLKDQVHAVGLYSQH